MPTTATSRSLTMVVRPATFSDHSQIASLEARYGLGTKSYEEWTHLWSANPAFRSRPDWIIGWVIEDANQHVVGSLGNIPLEYTFDGRRILACSGRGLVADPAYRSACTMLLDRLINHSTADLYVNNTVGPDAAASFRLFECPRVPSGVWDQAAFWIASYTEFFASVLRPKVHYAANVLTYPLSAAAFINDCWGIRALRARDARVESCDGFDDRFDEFWEALKGKRPKVLLAVRNRETLAWHFKYALLHNRLWIATVNDASRLVAYAIFERRDAGGVAAGMRRMRMVDFQTLEPDSSLLCPLLSWALQRCRRQGIHLLENVGAWLENGELVRSLAPYRRKLPNWTYYYRANFPGLARSLADRNAWAPSLYDGDATL